MRRLELKENSSGLPIASMKDYYDQYWSQDTPPPTADRHADIRSKLLWARLPAMKGLRFLDCGCGEGRLVAEAAYRGAYSTGIEISEVVLARARSRFSTSTFIEHSVERRPWPIDAGSIDIAVAFEVIEHLMLPRELLVGAAAVLRAGGHLALTTPYHGLLKNIAVSVTGFDRHFNPEGEHIRFFTDRTLIKLIREAGFSVEEVVHFGRLPRLWAGVFVWAVKL